MARTQATAREVFPDRDAVSQVAAPSAALSSRGAHPVLVGVVLAVLASLVVWAVCEVFYWTSRAELGRKQAEPVNELLTSTQNREKDLLSRNQWVKQAEGRLRIPLERARDLVLAERRQAAQSVDAGAAQGAKPPRAEPGAIP